MTAVVSELEVLIGASTAGLQAGLRDADSAVNGFAQNAASSLSSLGASMTRLGLGLTAISAPLVAGLGAAVNVFKDFDEAMTNAGAVLGRTATEMEGVRIQVASLGDESRFGAQAMAEAFYEIASGVTDASQQMPILIAAQRTAEAGAASLDGTVSALISTMNAYGAANLSASHASDVLTRTVAVGVGSMDEFASALPKVTSLAAQLGISFDDVGAAAAYLTTKGYTASEAATSLTQAMISLLNPNKEMQDALAAIGAESGSAAIRTYGLAGTFDRLRDALGGSTDRLVRATGNVEGLRAVLGLTSDEFDTFAASFRTGVEGATEAARAIQLDSLAAQMDLVSAAAQGVSREIGAALAPALADLARGVTTVLIDLRNWVSENPQTVQAIAAVAVVVGGLGIVLTTLGIILPVIATGIGVVGAALTFLLANPIVLVMAGIAALAVAFITNFGGIRDTVARFVDQVVVEFNSFMFQMGYIWGNIRDSVVIIVGVLWERLKEAWANIVATVAQAAQDASDAVNQIFNGIWDILRGILDSLGIHIDTSWQEIRTTIVDWINDSVQSVVNIFAGVWNRISPIIDALKTSLAAAFQWISDNIITPIANAIEEVARALGLLQQDAQNWSGAGGGSGGGGGGGSRSFGTTFSAPGTTSNVTRTSNVGAVNLVLPNISNQSKGEEVAAIVRQVLMNEVFA